MLGTPTLSSPLRGLAPAGRYPSRLRSLRSLRLPACPAARFAHRRLPDRHRRRGVRRQCSHHRRALLAPALRTALVADLASLALAGYAGCGHRHGSPRCTPCAAGCRLRRAPLAALVRTLLRTCGARPHFAPHRGSVRTVAAQAPRRLHSASRARGSSPIATFSTLGLRTPWEALIFSHHTHHWCPRKHARACHTVSCANADKWRLDVDGSSVYRTSIRY